MKAIPAVHVPAVWDVSRHAPSGWGVCVCVCRGWPVGRREGGDELRQRRFGLDEHVRDLCEAFTQHRHLRCPPTTPVVGRGARTPARTQQRRRRARQGGAWWRPCGRQGGQTPWAGWVAGVPRDAHTEHIEQKRGGRYGRGGRDGRGGRVIRAWKGTCFACNSASTRKSCCGFLSCSHLPRTRVAATRVVSRITCCRDGLTPSIVAITACRRPHDGG